MAIALERYLIPKISKNQETSYRLALCRICTSLTKGWFRQFAIDNYLRLLNLDKDLLSIANNVISNNPLKPKKQEVPSLLLHEWVLDPDTRAIFEPIHSCTKKMSNFKSLGSPSGRYNRSDDFETHRSGIEIISPVNKDISITAIATTACLINYDDCKPGADWWASIAILPSEDLKDLR
jgi:hypothetical protein